MSRFLTPKNKGFTHAPESPVSQGGNEWRALSGFRYGAPPQNREKLRPLGRGGFTIIELLVTISISLIVIGITTTIFIALVREQRKIFAEQELQNQTSYALEYMSRALRMAKIDDNGVCLSQAGKNYDNPDGDVTKIKFINHLENDVCQEFFLDADGILKERKNWDEPVPLISNKLQVNFVKFNLSGDFSGDLYQPRVTIFLEIQFKGTGNQPKIKIQTTVSQRNLDI